MERVAPQLIQLRLTSWLREYTEWMTDILHIERFAAWMALAILIFPLILVIWMINGVFENALWGLFELAFNVVIIFFCLGPKELDSQVDNYIDSLETGDEQSRQQIAAEIISETPAQELSTQVLQVCKAIYMQANMRLFAVLFWFVVLGPVAAVTYRLLEQLLNSSYLQHSLNSVKQVSRSVLAWLDWIPTRITLFVYMISGNFEEGLKQYHQGSVVAVEIYDQNMELLQNVGFQSIANHEVSNTGEAIDLIRKSRGLILRSMVVWLLLILFFNLIM